jgi:amino acid transporter
MSEGGEVGQTQCSIVDKLRGPKVLDMSVFDWVAALIGGFLIGYYVFRLNGVAALTAWMVGWVVFGVVAHLIAGVNTMFGYYLGLNAKPDRSKKC